MTNYKVRDMVRGKFQNESKFSYFFYFVFIISIEKIVYLSKCIQNESEVEKEITSEVGIQLRH